MKTITRSACPACGSTAYYRYGRASNGKPRRICLICNRQYVVRGPEPHPVRRPACPKCGQPMHRYRRQPGVIRFRCRDYPACRTYLKISIPSEAGSPPDPAVPS